MVIPIEEAKEVLRVPAEDLQPVSPWPHRSAFALACATFPLIWVGGLVTTTDAGMAVPDWPNTYGYNLFLYPWSEWFFGPWDLFIEHGHRLFGAVVGMLAIGLVAALWRFEPRRWVRWFGLCLLGLVVVQGLLGGLRVLLDERTLAMIHGCTAPIFFALAAAMSVVTSERWRESGNRIRAGRQLFQENSAIDATAAGRRMVAAIPDRRFRQPQSSAERSVMWLALACTCLAYTQLFVGALLRHVPATASAASFRGHALTHVMLACILAVAVGSLAIWTRRMPSFGWAGRPAKLLVALVLVQLALGAGTWLMKFAAPAWLATAVGGFRFAIPAGSGLRAAIITGHVATGSLIVATACVTFLRAGRLAVEVRSTPFFENQLNLAKVYNEALMPSGSGVEAAR